MTKDLPAVPFDRLVITHGRTVLRVCRAAVGPDDADDAWSETFLAALRAYPDLPADANHEAWLVTIAHRKSIDLLRKRNRLPVPSEPGTHPDPHSTLGLPELTANDDVWPMVKALPNRQRTVIGYRYLGGLDYNTIAGLLGITPAAARRAAADGLRNLRTSSGQFVPKGESDDH